MEWFSTLHALLIRSLRRLRGKPIGIGFFVMENFLPQAPAPLEAARVLLAVNLIISSNRDRSRTTASE
jgi:hypothetical protein